MGSLVEGQRFMAAMADGQEWPQVFGMHRELVARNIAAILRAQRPTESERLTAALVGLGERRVKAYDNGVKWLRANYYEHSHLLDS